MLVLTIRHPRQSRSLRNRRVLDSRHTHSTPSCRHPATELTQSCWAPLSTRHLASVAAARPCNRKWASCPVCIRSCCGCTFVLCQPEGSNRQDWLCRSKL